MVGCDNPDVSTVQDYCGNSVTEILNISLRNIVIIIRSRLRLQTIVALTNICLWLPVKRNTSVPSYMVQPLTL